MAGLSQNFLDTLGKVMLGGIPVKRANMDPLQKLRYMIVREAYQIWIGNKQISPMKVCRNISIRMYADLLEHAKSDPETNEFIQAVNIFPGKKRDPSSLAKDVEALNYLVANFNQPTAAIDKFKVVDASEWLMKTGMAQGNDRSVKSGADLLMKLHNDFIEKENDFDKLAHTDINITGDVSVVKPNQTNYSDEEKLRIAKKFGLPVQEVEDMILKSNGVYETAPSEEEPEKDIYIENEL